jgi:N-acetyl-anhydromuramyl-L-alanine amidase AmpD
MRGNSLDISEQEIDAMHRARGFDEIGYNYVVRFDGTIEKGRPEDHRGAHARQWDERGVSYNASSIAICFAGNCDAARWTTAQQASGYRLILEIMRRYNVPAERVVGHRECGNDTHCPGMLIDMEKVRDKLRQMENPQPIAEP